MDIKRMYEIIEKLSESVKCEFDKGVENVDTCEMKEAIDMMKDTSMAMYYRVLTNSMLESDTEEIMDMFDRYGEDRRFYDHYRYKNGRFAPKGHGTYRKGYEEPPYYHMMPYEMSVGDYKEHSPEYWRDVDRANGRLYFSEPMKETTNMANAHDKKDGRSWKSRRGYMESKELHKANTPEDKQQKMRDLEAYTKELAEDVTEMIADASPEERSLLKQKLQVLTQKIG